MQDYREFLDEILVSQEKLMARVAELGAQISQDYANHDLHLICILRGGVVFLSDLMRFITVPHTVDFMAVSSYGAERQSTGQVRITMDLKEDISAACIAVHPNPTEGRISIDVGNRIQTGEVIITNIMGQEVSRKQFSNASVINLEIEGGSGVYFVTVRAGEKTATAKIIKY